MSDDAKESWLRRLLPYLFRHKRSLVLALGASLIGQSVTALTPVVEKVLIDDVITTHRRSLALWLTLLIAAGALRFGLAFVRRFFGGRIALDVQYDIRNDIYDRLQRLDFARHDQLETGQLVSRASSDVALLQGLLQFLPLMTGNIVMLVLSIGVMAVLSPPLTLVTLLVVPAVALVALRMRTTLFPAAWHAQERTAEVAGVVDEAVTGVRVVKGFGQEDRELARLVDSARDLYGSRVRMVKVQARMAAALESIPSLGQVGILVLGGWLALHDRISLGTFLAFSSYLLQLVGPARMFAVVLAVAQLARAGAERIFEVIDANPVVVEKPEAGSLPAVVGEIDFENVVFGYLPTEPVLDGFSLKVQPGETVALVGASGSGKSTVSLLLPRFYDVRSGAVRIDGVDVRDVTFESLRRQIGVVFEDAFLFSSSVRENIAYGRPDSTFEEVVAAARAAEADEFIRALPDGYDTVVGERGMTLSGGQRQRVTLARALLTQPHVLVLDDATSAIDAKVEEEIHATLRRLMQGRTTLLVAHRRSTLRLADRIVVVDHGRAVDSGSHEELLARSELYRLLLAGPGEDAEGLEIGAEAGLEDIVVAGDQHVLQSAAGVSAAGVSGAGVSGAGVTAAGVTAAAWPREAVDEATRRARADAGRALTGAGGGGGGPGFMGGAALPASPELLAAVDKLPPADDQPDVDVAAQAAYDPHFTLRRFVRPFRRQLVVGALLVTTDALLTLAGPALVRLGVDRGVIHHSQGALNVAAVLFFGAVVLDWGVMYAQSRYLGRASERMLFALRVRIFAHLQRLSVDYYDREMAGRIMTRMTNDVEALSTLLQTGLISALVNVVTFGGIAVALTWMNWRLSLATFTVVPPLLIAMLWFRRQSDRAYSRARDRVAEVNANLQESLSGVRVAQAYSRESVNEQQFREVAGQHLEARVSAQRLVATFFPFVEFLSEVAAAVVLGFGAVLISRGSLTRGELIAFLLYLDQFFAPIQQLSQVFDTYQQARASTAKIDELMATRTGTPPAERPVAVGRLRGAVRFEDVHFAYGVASEAQQAATGASHPGAFGGAQRAEAGASHPGAFGEAQQAETETRHGVASGAQRAETETSHPGAFGEAQRAETGTSHPGAFGEAQRAEAGARHGVASGAQRAETGTRHGVASEAQRAETRTSHGVASEAQRAETETSHPGAFGEAHRAETETSHPGAFGEALRGVSLEVAPGELVALVGETGAGKSTIVKLAARFYDPTAGAVLVDGHDLRSLDLGSFRRQLGYVPQEPFLFSGTIRDNIAYGRPSATDAEVEDAARAVGAHDFIAGLTGGYLHVVTERGRSLSAGQRQLIALARARLVDPAILLLDEATSNLDLATEARVQRAMGLVARGRTTFVIAHRLPTAASADRILVIDDGLVVEQGTHAELLAQGGRYAELWQTFAPEPAA